MYTCDADVGRLEVRRQIFRARLGSVQRRVGRVDATSTLTGTLPVEVPRDVRRAADITVTSGDAATGAHAPEARADDEDDVADASAAGVEIFVLTVVANIARKDCCQRNITYIVMTQVRK